MGNKSIYLAGAIRGLSYGGAVDWRNEVKTAMAPCNIVCYSPMRHKEFMERESNGAMPYSFELDVLTSSKGIMTRDRMDVMNADLIFVNLLGTDKVSIGTMIELGWADAFRKPVVIAMEENNIHRHAMVDQIPGFIVTSLHEAIDVTKNILMP